MSKGIRRPAITTPFDAKHIIVASCAAVAMIMGAMSVTTSINNSGSGSGASAQSSSIVKAQEIRTAAPTKSTGLTSKHTLEVREFLQTQNTTPLYSGNAATPAKNLRNTFSTVITNANPVLFISQIVPLVQPPVAPVSAAPAASDSTSTSSSSATTASGDNSGTTTTDSGTNPTTSDDATTNPPPDKTQPSDSGNSGTSGDTSTQNTSQDPPPSSP